MWEQNKTFEELADEIGLSTIFEGTEADESIQQAFLEWLFDYRLCSDNDNTFLRYFRRRFNNLYPRYLEQVRVLTIKANFDPFVTEYFQDVLKRSGSENTSNTKTGSGEVSNSVVATKGSGSVTVRTPDLETEVTDTNTVSNTQNTTNSGSDALRRTGTETIDRDGTDTLTKTGTDSLARTGTEQLDKDATNTTTRTGTDATANSEQSSSSSSSKSDAFGIAYPEANLNSIPADLTTPRSIDYANSESLSLASSETSGSGSSTSTVTHNTVDDLVVDETDVTTHNTLDTTTHNTTDTNTHDTTDVTTHNTTDTTSYGMITDATSETEGNNHSIQSESGTETTTVTNSGSDTTVTEGSNSTSETDSGQRTSSDNVKQEHKGRHESVADIVPRAVKAIINTNELMWFIDSMKVCFDCTSML